MVYHPGPLVKRLRHRPLTAKTGVRFSYGSPHLRIYQQVITNNCDHSLQFIVGVYYEEGPPVPIPNTVVKLFCAENTWREAARENRSMPTSFQKEPLTRVVLFSLLKKVYKKSSRKLIFLLFCFHYGIAPIFKQSVLTPRSICGTC